MATRRVDEQGRAFKGSQLQVQIYVNRRQADLDDAIRKALPDLDGATLHWVAPLEDALFVEPSDVAIR